MEEQTETELKKAGLTPLQAARLALELVELSGARRCRGTARLVCCRRLLYEAAQNRPRTVSFAHAVNALLESRHHRRPRTQAELRGVLQRMMRACPGLSARRLSTLSSGECSELLRQVLPTVRQQRKGRIILHSLFALAQRRGWCTANPIAAVEIPPLEEGEIRPLTIAELRVLLRIARSEPHRCCMPALGVMLWAGVRPAEVERLCWQDIDWEEQVLVLRPRHSKTGGCRHARLHPPLAAWLREYGVGEQGRLCPPDWVRRWRALRVAAGLVPWQQDALRHTFASYHAKYFRNFAVLQEEMGHRSATLLRTRYLSMRGVTAAAAELFWRAGAL